MVCFFFSFIQTHKWSWPRYGRRRRGRMLSRWACTQTYLCVCVCFCIQNVSWLTTTAKSILNQALWCWRVEATFLDQTHVSFSLAVYMWCYLKRDQAMQVSAGTGGIFDFISNHLLLCWHHEEFSIPAQQEIILCFLHLAGESTTFPFFKSTNLTQCIFTCSLY